MSWPLASHFSAMLQNPRIAFRDPRLQQCRVEKDERSQPRPWAGAFAVVYKALDGAGGEPFAVRVFTTESPERRERYDSISAYLKHRKLKCLVDFEYRDRSIRSAGDGKWYPMILMDWVQGETMFRWVRARSLEGNVAALSTAAQRWVELVRELAQACLAHGDLQHGNVMVTEAGELKLVDYDCMCVPALVGRRNLEVGVEPYQHPGRNEATLLSLDLDNFSALVIYVALRALAAVPQLWQKYVEQTGYDKLLFRKEDFHSPANSPLYRELMQSPDEEVRDLTRQLFSLVSVRMDQVPPLSQVANSFAKVEQLLLRQEWEAAVEVLNRRGQFRDAPNHLKPLIHQAYEHVCRQQAWAAFQRVPPETSEENDRRRVDAWNEVLFAGYEPAERQRVRVAEARRRVSALDRLYHVIQQSSGTISLPGEQKIVDAAARLPQGYRYGLQARVERATRRVAAVARLNKVLAEPVSEAAVVAAWRAVVEAECEALVDDDLRPRIELAERRAPVLRALDEIPEDAPADGRDPRILEVWQEDLLAGCKEADRWRPAYHEAVARKEMLHRLQAAVEARNEGAIVALIREPALADYPLPAVWEPVVEAVRDRVDRAEALEAVLERQELTAFHGLFDARLVRRYPQRFAPYQSLLCAWIASEVLDLEKLGLQPAVGRGSLVPLRDPPQSYRVRWTWPPPRFADQCLLAVCPRQPGPDEEPEALAVHLRLPIDRRSWERGGGSRVISTQPDWTGSYVVVWAIVCLGFRQFYSPPLVLGRLKGSSLWKWRGLRVFSLRHRGHPRPAAEDEHA